MKNIYDTIDNFQNPNMVTDLCQQLVNAAQKHDPKLPNMNPTHLLLLYYATAGTFFIYYLYY